MWHKYEGYKICDKICKTHILKHIFNIHILFHRTVFASTRKKKLLDMRVTAVATKKTTKWIEYIDECFSRLINHDTRNK